MLKFSLSFLKQLSLRQGLQMALAFVIRRLEVRIPRDIFAMGSTLQFVHKSGGTLTQEGPKTRVSLSQQGDAHSVISLRRMTTDFEVFNQVFREKQYASLVAQWRTHGPHEPRYIIDAGANIGCTTLYFKQQFPDARILAVEPESGNFSLLKENIELNGYQDTVIPVKKGIWVREALLAVSTDFRGGREWSFSLQEVETPGEQDLEGVTVAGLASQHGFPHIDILKMDIEGAEAYLFQDQAHFRHMLSQVQTLAIEIHEEKIDPHEVLQVLEAEGFFHIGFGEVVFAYKKPWFNP